MEKSKQTNNKKLNLKMNFEAKGLVVQFESICSTYFLEKMVLFPNTEDGGFFWLGS